MPVPGLNGVHYIGGVGLGDRLSWPRFRIDSIPGFKGLAELEDQRDLPAGRGREIPRKSLRRGRAFTYQGVIMGRDLDELNAGEDALIMACEPTAEMRVSVASLFDLTVVTGGYGGGTYGGAEGAEAAAPSLYWYTARVTALDIPEQHPDPIALRHESGGHERGFALGMRMSDARFFAEGQQVQRTAGITSSGGTPLPWTLPVVIGAPGAASGSVTVINTGTAPADPIVDLFGPSTNPGIRSETLGLELRFTLELTAGQFLRLDFRDRSALLNGTEDVHHTIDRARSTWWDGDAPGLASGANVLRYVADVLQDPAVATISFHDAYWS